MTFKQRLKIKISIVDANNHLNGIFPVFDSLNSKSFSGSRLIDIFSSYFSFHRTNCINKESKASHICKLNNGILNISSNPNSVIVVSNTSIRNNVATSIIYIHSFSNLVRKTLHHTVNITTTEAKLFAIRCGINQAIQILNTSHIIIITDSIHLAQYIFDSTIYSYQ